MEPKNREQRRREKFGKAGGVTKEPWPTSEANPALSGATGDQAVDTGTPDQDVTTKPVQAVAALAQGRDAAKDVLKSDPALYQEIETAVKAKLDEDKKL